MAKAKPQKSLDKWKKKKQGSRAGKQFVANTPAAKKAGKQARKKK
jgi:hypothetical protein